MLSFLHRLEGYLTDWWYNIVGMRRITSWASHYLIVRIPTALAVALFGFSGLYFGFVLAVVYLGREAVQAYEADSVDTVDKVGDWVSAMMGFVDVLMWTI